METPRKKETHELYKTPSPPAKEDSPKNREARGSNRSHKHKGINFNIAVTPSTTTEDGKSKSQINSREKEASGSVEGDKSKVEEQSNNAVPAAIKKLRYEVPLPPEEQLANLTIEEQTSLLALKEMSVVYLKDSINQLIRKLEKSEEEVHKLREVIQRSLYKEVTPKYTKEGEDTKGARPRQVSNPRDEAVANTQNKSRRKSKLSSGGRATSMDEQLQSEEQTQQSSAQGSHSIWSNIAKPLNLLQQFDTMLQNDVEKLLLQDSQDSPADGTMKADTNASSERRINNDKRMDILRGSKMRDRNHFQDLSERNGGQDNNEHSQASDQKVPDDFLQTVSSSVWSFVNDVKANMMSYTDGNQSHLSQQLRPHPPQNYDQKKLD